MSADASALRRAIAGWADRVLETSARQTIDEIDAEQWIVGHPRDPFDPHQRLARATFEDRRDDVLANPGSFPSGSHFEPGDHRGCQCRIDELPIRLVGFRGGPLRTAFLEARPTSSPPAVGRIRGGMVVVSHVPRGTPAWWPRALRREWPGQLRRAARLVPFVG